MGCGILFPPDYDSEADSDLSPDENSSPDFLSNEDQNDYDLSDSDDDLMWGGEGQDESGTKVQVCYQWIFSLFSNWQNIKKFTPTYLKLTLPYSVLDKSDV